MNKRKRGPICNFIGLEGRAHQAKFGWNFGEIWMTQANKTQLKVEQDPTDGVLRKIGESWE